MNLVLCTLLVFIFSTCIIPGLDSIDILNCALGRVKDWLCPEDGGWSQWSVWGQCEGECGTVGRQVRYRNCSNPRPERNGLDCDGNQLEVKQCTVQGCSYEQFEKLVAHDAVRQQQLAKLKLYSGSQSSLLTKCLSSHCDLSDISQVLPNEQTKFWNALICLKKNIGCPAAGGWSDWSSWTRCNSKCGSGQQMRCRACCDPPPSTFDMTCPGDACEYQPCSGVNCGQPLSNVGEWSSWSDWSACSALCNFGYMRRKRVCQSKSQISSDKKTTNLNSVNDYNDAENYANADDYLDYWYYNDGTDRAADYSEYSNMDNVDDTQYSFKDVKRSRRSNKVEYDSDYEDEYLLPTTLKGVSDTRKIKKKAAEQLEHTAETTDEKSGTFQKTKGRKLEAELESVILTLSSLNLDSEQVTRRTSGRLKKENLLERANENKIIDKESNEDKTKTSTNQPNSIGLVELNNKFTTKSLKLKNKRRKEIDENENDMDECTGELYKNPLTTSLCKNRKNGVYVTKSLLANSKHKKCSSSTVSSSTLNLESLKPDIIVKRPTTSKVNVISLQPSSSSKLPSSTIVLESEVTYIETTIFSEANAVNLETSTSMVTVIDSDSVKKTSFFPTSNKKQSFSGSQESSLVTRANDFSIESVTTPSVYSAESPSKSTSKKSFFKIFPKKASTVASRTIQDLPTSSAFQTTLNMEIAEVSETPQNITELNGSITRQISCDLSKKMELPEFSDSFLAEGCSGPFEEIKPCNTQPCNEDGDWSDWSSWSPCSPDCGLGWQVSMRSCTNPEPRRNDSQCRGETMRRRSCYLQPCSVNLRTEKAVFMTGDSLVRYDAVQQHSSILLLYVRFRHFSPTGSVVARRRHECVRNCNHVTLSLYRSHVLISVVQQGCHTDFLSNQRLSIGDWHEVLLTIVGAAVTLRLDDSLLTQKFNLSCRPSTPNYDADMKVGGTRFVGEVDRLSINFKNYVFQKKLQKSDSWPSNDALIVPVESSQVQYEVNSKEVPTVSLSQFLQAPCYTNHSSWNLDLAIKPNFPDGLVLFMKGYDSRDFLFISLEQTRIRLRVRVGAQGGECEHSDPVAPLTWLHLGLSRPPGGPVGLSVNGGSRCVVSLAPSSSEEPAVYCTGGILMGEMPLRVKTVLSSETGHAEPIHSPLGLLGHLSVDNHTLDLTRLPRKIAPDLTTKHPDDHYKLSSHTAASTVYYEEMQVLEGERLSMPCIYDLSPENLSDVNSIQELSMNWYKLDSPVKTIFTNESGVYYETTTTGKAFSLNITRYSSMEAVEGFYSCWLIYPLPLQYGFNIVSYGVIIVSTTQDKHSWWFWLMIAHFCFVVILLVLLVLSLLYETYQDYKQGSGFFRCKKLKDEEAYEATKLFIFSDKAINRLGGKEASEEAFARYLKFREQEALSQALRETEAEAENTTADATATDTYIASDYEDSHHSSGKEQDIWKNDKTPKKKSSESEIFHSFPDQHIYIPKREHMKPVNVTVGVTGVEFDSPFKQNYWDSNESRIRLEELLQSDTEETREISTTAINDNLIDVSNTWTQKEVTGQTSRDTIATDIGQIQNSLVYRSIENELKFKRENFKNLEKYMYSTKNKNDK